MIHSPLSTPSVLDIVNYAERNKKSEITAGRSQKDRFRPLAPLTTVSWLQRLACFFFSAFFQRRLARKLNAAFVVDADAFDPNHVADLDHILGALHPKIGELRNVHQAVFAGENFDKRPELLRRNDSSLISLSD